MKKHRKPRTAVNRPWNKWLERNNHNSICPYYDGTNKYGNAITECNCQWESQCDGDIFKCGKIKCKIAASIKDHVIKGYE